MAMTPAERSKLHRERQSQREDAQQRAVDDAIEIAKLRTEVALLRKQLERTEKLLDRALGNRDGVVADRFAEPRHENSHENETRDETTRNGGVTPRLARGSQDLSLSSVDPALSTEQAARAPARGRDGRARNENRHENETRDETMRNDAALEAIFRAVPDIEDPGAVARSLGTLAGAVGVPSGVTLIDVAREACAELTLAGADVRDPSRYVLGICRTLLDPGELAARRAARNGPAKPKPTALDLVRRAEG